MELTKDQIEDLKSLVRVSMEMHDKDNWENGEYFGDARKFWKGAEIGVDLWVKKMRVGKNPDTSDEALHIGSVGDSREVCGTCGSADFAHYGFCPKCNTDAYSY